MRFLRIGLLGRIALGLLVVGALPLALAAALLIQGNRAGMKRSALEAHMVAVRAAVDRVDAHLTTRRSLTQAVANNPVLPRDPRSPESIALVQGLIEQLPDVASVSIRTHDGELVLRLRNSSFTEEIESAESAPYSSPIEAVSAAGRTWLRFTEAIAETDGMLVVLSDPTPLEESLTHVALLEQAEMVLADAAGNPIAGSVDALELVSEETLDRARSKKVLGTTDAGGSFVAYDWASAADWFVLSRQPTDVALAASRSLLRKAALALGLAALLIVGLSSLAYRSVVKPIRDLTRQQMDLAGVTATPGGRDEIAQLKESFEALRKGFEEGSDVAELDDTFLGRFSVREVLGTGSMGMVFRGWDPRLKRPVALKTLRLDEQIPVDERKPRTERLVNEALTVARLNDPHIVGIFDVEQEEDVAFIAMELVDGMSLYEYLELHGRLPQEEAARFGAAIASALAAAHRRGFVHQDIKPGNVLIGLDGRIKVADFGISSMITAASATGGESIFGTPGYLPPEALSGEGFRARSDLFALGVVLYQCVTGQRPFWGRSLTETIHLTMVGSPRRPTELGAQLDPEFEALLSALLDPDPDQRPADAAEVAAQLERWVPRTGSRWLPDFHPKHLETHERESPHERPHSRLLPTDLSHALEPTRRTERPLDTRRVE